MASSLPPPSLDLRRDLVVAMVGHSIELSALAARLSEADTVVQWVPRLSATQETPAQSPHLLVCDLASRSCLCTVTETLRDISEPETTPLLVTLGSPQEALSIEHARTVHDATLGFPRPLDIAEVARQVLNLGSQATTSLPPLSLGASQPLSRSTRSGILAPTDHAPLSAGSSASRPEEAALGPASRSVPSPAQEPTAVSPELEFLLADAQQKLAALVSEEAEAAEPLAVLSQEPSQLADNVWQALAEPLDDDELPHENWRESGTGDELDELQGHPVHYSSAAPGTDGHRAASTVPPPGAWASPLPSDEDTGSQAAVDGASALAVKPAQPEQERVEAFTAGHTLADIAGSLAASAPPSAASLMPTLAPPRSGPMSAGSVAPGTKHSGSLSPRSLAPLTLSPRTLSPASLPSGSLPPGSRKRQPSMAPTSPPTVALAPATVAPPTTQAGPRHSRFPPQPSTHAAPRPSLPVIQDAVSRTVSPPPATVGEAPVTAAPRAVTAPLLAPSVASTGPNAPTSAAESETCSLPLPEALRLGASGKVLGAAVRKRFTGCLAFEVDHGLRRAIFRDGDFVLAASAVHGESLVAFLVQRGDIPANVAQQVEHRVPMQGRHAGAALIARGLIEQGELWPVLRAHAEWVLLEILRMDAGHVEAESPIPERLAAEPAVFGGATGAEVLVDLVQRAVPVAEAHNAIAAAGHGLEPAEDRALLSECALSARLKQLVEGAEKETLDTVLANATDHPMLPCVLYALTLLNVLRVRQQDADLPPRLPNAQQLSHTGPADAIDDDAIRSRIQARRAVIDEGDYFAVLGVARKATSYDIRRSYLDLRRQFSPDTILRPATVDLQEDVDVILEVVQEAYDILRDQRRRDRYLRAIEASPS